MKKDLQVVHIIRVMKNVEFKSFRGAKNTSLETLLSTVDESKRVAVVAVMDKIRDGGCISARAVDAELAPVGLDADVFAALASHGHVVEWTPKSGLVGGIWYSMFELCAPAVPNSVI